ncbi:MAG: hypothetical protein ACLPLR_16350, partial [Terriglobales bacterium]
MTERSEVNRRFRCYARSNLVGTIDPLLKTVFAPEESLMRDHHPASRPPDPPPSRLEREESQLWRWALWLLVLFAAAVAALSWQELKDLPYRLWA